MDTQNNELLELIKGYIEQTPPKPDGIKPIIVTDEDRQRIEKAIGCNISSSKELADRLVRALEVRIDGIEVPLTPYLLDRLKSRAIRVDWEKFVPMTIKRLLEEYVGLR